MSDKEMIKRVAEAICDCKLETWHPNVQIQLLEQAERIIKAMKEPTEAMVIAALHHYMACEKEKRPWNGREMYKTMINHILAN